LKISVIVWHTGSRKLSGYTKYTTEVAVIDNAVEPWWQAEPVAAFH
jgi:hypothetical protein